MSEPERCPHCGKALCLPDQKLPVMDRLYWCNWCQRSSTTLQVWKGREELAKCEKEMGDKI